MTLASAPTKDTLQRLISNAAWAQDWLLDLVFPPVCGKCGRVDYRFCPDCLRELEQVPVAVSRLSVEELDDLCATGAHAGALQYALQAFKYESVTELSEPLAARLVKALQARDWNNDIIIVPVPLFVDREEERGYNQAALLGGHVAAETGIPARSEILTRVRATSQQASLNEQERRVNVKDAFAACATVKGLSVLLIDDVATTGSTLRECAAALRAQGAGKVYGMAVSHSLSSQWVRQEAIDENQCTWRRD